ncbi:MAG: hypothetical protein WCK89_16765 [bacterium]
MNKLTAITLTAMLLAPLFAHGADPTQTAGVLCAETAKITVQADRPGVKVSPSLWGIFYEEINHAGDGGIYAELVQNRAFEETQPAAGSKMEGDQMVTPKGFKYRKWYKHELHAWSKVADNGAEVSMALDDSTPLNDKTPHSLRLEVRQIGARAGVANE